MKVIITSTVCYDNLWKSVIMALEKPGKLRDFFLLHCGHLWSGDHFDHFVATVIVMEVISREWELLYADDLVVIAETHDLIERLNEWKNSGE